MSNLSRVAGVVLAAVCALAGAPALRAQQSASFRVEAATLNAGGHPGPAAVPTSGSFRITFGSLGDPGTATETFASSYRLRAGLTVAFAPPREVRHVRFTGPTTLVWDPDGSTGDYGLYQGNVTEPFDPAFGACAGTAPVATAEVGAVAAPGQTLFLLVTARNRLGEESSTGPGRPTPAACP